MSPPEFENMSGFHSNKWRQNIRLNGKPVGKWLAKYNSEGVIRDAPSQSSQSDMSLERKTRSTSSLSGDVLATPETSGSTGDVDIATQLNGQECISHLSGLQGISQVSRD